jgi:hypothetical protein
LLNGTISRDAQDPVPILVTGQVARDDVPRDLTEAEFEEIKKFGAE